MNQQTKPSANEGYKQASRYLRGTLKQSLCDFSTGSIPEDDAQLLKFLGATLQDNRDTRIERKKAGLEREYSYMVRLRMPGGRISPKQWLQLDALSTSHGNGSLKLTTRQAIQLHAVSKEKLGEVMRGIDAIGLDCLASSGDATRNIMVSTARHHPAQHKLLLATAQKLAEELAPATGAYKELWLGAAQTEAGKEEEPLYGATYLPRKFKIGFSLPPENDADVYAQDLGLIAVLQRGRIIGYNVVVGGGQGCAYGNKNSYPRIAHEIGFIPAEALSALARQVLIIHREFSDRSDRKLSRLRYTIDRNGLPWFLSELGARGVRVEPWKEIPPMVYSDTFGRTIRSTTVIPTPGGRIDGALKEALREIAALSEDDFYVTGNQNLMVPAIGKGHTVAGILKAHGCPAQGSILRQEASSCTGLPYCPQAFADSERVLEQLVGSLEQHLQTLKLTHKPIALRLSGCSNGCARPYTAEIGLTGRGPGKYNILLGGSRRGDRLAFLYRSAVNLDSIGTLLGDVLSRYKNERAANEGFGDWCFRNQISLQKEQV